MICIECGSTKPLCTYYQRLEEILNCSEHGLDGLFNLDTKARLEAMGFKAGLTRLQPRHIFIACELFLESATSFKCSPC